MNSKEAWKDERNLDDDLPFTDLEEEFEEINRLNKIIIELKDLLKELMDENQGLRAAIDRQNGYHETAIKQFNKRNSKPKEGRKWHKVQFEGCFYDDMVGWFVESTDKTITLKFGEKIGQATFYKHQLEFYGEF